MNYNPTSVEELSSIVQNANRICSHGNRTKQSLVDCEQASAVDMRGLSGIIDYEPDEYVLTAYAGTSLKEIREQLSGKGQYLPFDPLFVDAGATLGGTIAANSCGPGRFRYGGIRDFILRTCIVDGKGRFIRGGEKVVKNAAGFDLPKFFTGSRGKFGILTEASFKVFPKPSAYLTLEAQFTRLTTAINTLVHLSGSSFEMDALDLVPLEFGVLVQIRLGGLAAALTARSESLIGYLYEQEEIPDSITTYEGPAEELIWRTCREFPELGLDNALIYASVTPHHILQLEKDLSPSSSSRRYSCAGNMLFATTNQPEDVLAVLKAANCSAIPLAGLSVPFLHSNTLSGPLYARLKSVFDPDSIFGKF
ncbi:MAG: FAD-binding protein [Calditrichia bacterium]